jgi:hypothetical protein
MLARILLVVATLILSAAAARAQETESVVDRALADPNFTWRSFAADGVRLYYQPGSFAERHRIMLLRSAHGAMARGRAFLELEADERELRVIYLDDRAQMERAIGEPYAGLADTEGYGVFLVCNPDWRSFDTHEITHILSLGRWGSPGESSAWMIEGLPIAVDGWCQTADIDRIASYLMAAGRWPGLSAFTANASALGEVPGGIFAASLLRYLRGQYGAATIEEIWRTGLTAALQARKIDPARVEAEWLDSLKDPADPLTDAEWQKMDADGCG